MKYIVSAICVVMLLSPFRDINESEIEQLIPQIELDNSTVDNKTLKSLSEESVERYISDTVFSEFGIKVAYTDIKIDWESDAAVIESVSVALYKDDYENASRVKKRLDEMLGGEVELIGAE